MGEMQITSIKQAVILAGGRGMRLRPITDTIPKPMILFHNRPFLEYLIEMLKENEIKEVVLLLGYLPEKIVDYFGDGSKFGLKIKYSIGIGLTNNCDLDCAHCYRDKTQISNITLKQIQKLCKAIPISSIGMGTGENILNQAFH